MFHQDQQNVSKFDPRSLRGVFFVYSYHSKGYKVLDLTSLKIIMCWDVMFYEDDFPFTQNTTVSTTNNIDYQLPKLRGPFQFLPWSIQSAIELPEDRIDGFTKHNEVTEQPNEVIEQGHKMQRGHQPRMSFPKGKSHPTTHWPPMHLMGQRGLWLTKS